MWLQTREERKMEAIMKAFEKLEKREERRKEALARMEHTRKGRPSKDEESNDAPPDTPVAVSNVVDSDSEPRTVH